MRTCRSVPVPSQMTQAFLCKVTAVVAIRLQTGIFEGSGSPMPTLEANVSEECSWWMKIG